MKTIRLALLAMIFGGPALALERWVYLDNGKVRLGVNLDAGGSIGWFSHARSNDNLLNSFDHGRYVQQSYYGDADGSLWNGKPWKYNPVQGGSWKGVPAVILEKKEQATQLYIKTQPRNWAGGEPITDLVMEQWLSLEGGLARLKFRMTYQGKIEHKARHQELPAVFVVPRCDTLVFCEKGSTEPVKKQPGKGNEYFHTSEPWAAWVDASGTGLGVYFPHASFFTCYRVRDSGVGNVSYLSPLQTFALKPGMTFDYETVLAIGTAEQLRSVFQQLEKQRTAPKK